MFSTHEPPRIIAGVFDGHGQFGEPFATIARDITRDMLRTAALTSKIGATIASRIRRSLLAYEVDQYRARGLQVDTTCGYVRYRKHECDKWTVANGGGTTATLLEYTPSTGEVVVAQVGDSSAYILRPGGRSVAITKDHEPTRETEYARLASDFPDPSREATPVLHCVYDTRRCDAPEVNIHDRDGDRAPSVAKHCYCKNVRGEWATVVCMPPQAETDDQHAVPHRSLAMTRSLGDFWLQAHGVIGRFEMARFNLNRGSNAGGGGDDHGELLVLASDGLWDNWKIATLAGAVLPRVSSLGAAACAEWLHAENRGRGRANFGASADNASGIVIAASGAFGEWTDVGGGRHNQDRCFVEAVGAV